MPFKKGRHKTGGRKKGSTGQKCTIKEAIKNNVTAETIIEQIELIEDQNKKVSAYIKLLSFAYPKMKAVDYSSSSNNEFVLTVIETNSSKQNSTL